MTFCETLPLRDLWIVLTISVLVGIIALAAAFYIFVKLSAEQRPRFVTYQTLLLICSSIPDIIFYSLNIS